MPTACHNEDLSDASWKLYFYKDSNIFFCYTEDGAMNAFKFLENYYMARDIKFNWYKDVFLVIKDCSNYRGDFEQAEVYKGIGDKYKKNDIYILDTYDNKILESFIKYYPDEWLDDGISKKAMDKFNPEPMGYVWDESNPRIQLEPRGERGYIELKAVKKI